MRQREGLIARVKQMRSLDNASDPRPGEGPSNPQPISFGALEARIERLEAVIEGLQDSVHRESARHGQRIADLEARTEPAALAVALSRDARQRGL